MWEQGDGTNRCRSSDPGAEFPMVFTAIDVSAHSRQIVILSVYRSVPLIKPCVEPRNGNLVTARRAMSGRLRYRRRSALPLAPAGGWCRVGEGPSLSRFPVCVSKREGTRGAHRTCSAGLAKRGQRASAAYGPEMVLVRSVLAGGGLDSSPATSTRAGRRLWRQSSES